MRCIKLKIPASMEGEGGGTGGEDFGAEQSVFGLGGGEPVQQLSFAVYSVPTPSV